jgi:glutamyl-tRNA synthetase
LTPRVRFAPSPTGYFHVGSARTSLFNWLYARQHGGTFVLRIEDTDAERGREEWLEGIITAMAWLGLEADEGPFRQSAFEPRHRELADKLYESGYLYACDCTRDAIDERTKDRKTPGYDGYCRDRGVARSATTGLRFRTPDTGETVVHDIIRGDVSFPHEAMEDFMAVKSSGAPLFPLANMIDDREMEISHVIRGEDLLPTAPKQILMWQALNEIDRDLPLPSYAHLPMLVNEQRKKLSKRKDPVAVESYRDKGYLPQAFVNYLALLGWAPKGGEEMLTLDQLVEQFELSDVNHAPAFFDIAKMTHINGEYIRAMDVDAFIAASQPWMNPLADAWTPADHEIPWTPEQFDEDKWRAIAPMVQERITMLSEIPAMVDFLFLDNPRFDETAVTKVLVNDADAERILEQAIAAFTEAEFQAEALHTLLTSLSESMDLKLRKTQAPIRVALTGSSVGPPLFESMVILGRDEVLRRLNAALVIARG